MVAPEIWHEKSAFSPLITTVTGVFLSVNIWVSMQTMGLIIFADYFHEFFFLTSGVLPYKYLVN